MKVLVTGAAGQLGHDVIHELENRGHLAIGSDIMLLHNPPSRTVPLYDENRDPLFIKLDITNQKNVQNVITGLKPDAIIHCAAWTNVDAAEAPQNREKVDSINHLGTEYIANTANNLGIKMMYLSTDYVFDGNGCRPWQPDDHCNPLNVYGVSKLNGEKAVAETLNKFFIVRSAWIFGLNGENFIKKMVNLGKTYHKVRVIDDQIGTPTYSFDLAHLLVDIIETDKYGYYHATNSESHSGEYISWADLAEEAYSALDLNIKVERVSTSEYGANIAARPLNSRLDKTKLIESGFEPLPDWKDAVHRYLNKAAL